jgi:RimJ/RimL family protein N-acetyltransferase
MLLVVKRLKDLDFRGLMELYAEGNRENGEEQYPQFSAGQQLLRAEADFYSYLQDVFFRTPNAVYMIWIENGKYCSALRLEPYQDGLLLEALETHPEHRRQGYAAELIRAVFANLGTGKIYSHVHKKNVASLRTHVKCGFARILEHAIYADGSVLHNSCTMLAQF